MPSTAPAYICDLNVRDYEIDSQGRAHHSNIVCWTEHARADFLREKGLSYSKLVEQGLHLVVTRMTYQFKTSIRPGEELSIRIWVSRERSKAKFYQEIVERKTGALRVIAETEVAALQDGRPTRGDFFDSLAAASAS